MRNSAHFPAIALVLLALFLLPASLSAQEGTLLAPSDPAWGDLFGRAVAISGSNAVVGAVYDDDGCGLPDCNTGSAYVFEQLTGQLSSWSQIAKLTAFDAQDFDYFGGSVAIDGDTIVVAAHGSDIAGVESGVAYLFERDQGGPNQWGFVTQLLGSTTAAGDRFGASVAIEGDLIAVSSSGGTSIFERNLGGRDNWGERTVVAASDAVAASGDTIVLGQSRNDSACPGNPDCNSGVAVVLGRNVGGPNYWEEVKTLAAPTPMQGGKFGRSVTVDQDTVAVGAMWDSDGLFNEGAAYVFERDLGGSENWGFSKKLVGSDLKESDRFGESISIEGDSLIVGTLAANCRGHVDAGAVYLFLRDRGGTDYWGEHQILCSQDLDWGEYFGAATDIESGLVIAGSHYDAVNCPEPLDPACSTGSASIYNLGIFFDGFESGNTLAWSKVTCNAIEGVRYADCGDGTIWDTQMDLFWLRDASCSTLAGTGPQGRGAFDTAVNAAALLSTGECGLSDGSQVGEWRLATRTEWVSAMAVAVSLGCTGASSPSLTNDPGHQCLQEGPSSFLDVKSDSYWTSTESGSDAFLASLDQGDTELSSKVIEAFVWPVRQP